MDNVKKILVLKGRFSTPLVTKKIRFNILDCKATIINPQRRYFTKISTSTRMHPYSFICYLGILVVRFEHHSTAIINEKLQTLLKMSYIGKFNNDGLGKIQWIEGYIRNDCSQAINHTRKRKLRIRKGLPSNLTLEQQQLLKYALLHDFFHTSKHQSKIYQEPQLTDHILVEQLRKHHEEISDPFIKEFQHYDGLAASITRKIRSPIISRYNWRAKRSFQKLNFNELAKEIQEVAETNIWKLYNYIYKSKELELLNESMNHGHTTLRNHLVVIANLIVQDFVYENRLRNKHKISK